MSLPIEFQYMPKLLPPNMDSLTNPDHDWCIMEDWKSPPINGKIICVRGGIKLPNNEHFGFWTDGITVPPLAWTISGISPLSMPELCWALPHDMAYAAELAPREICDNWLFEFTIMTGTNRIKRNLIYGLVRRFGGLVWDKHTKESIANARKVCQLINVGETPVWEPISV